MYLCHKILTVITIKCLFQMVLQGTGKFKVTAVC